MNRKITTVILIFAAVAFVAFRVATHAPALAQQASADLVLINGRIVTVDDARPEAQAIAVRGDTVAAIGTTAEIQKLVGSSTKVIDLKGQLAIPGFIEGHGHFTGLGEGLMNLNLMPMKSWQDRKSTRLNSSHLVISYAVFCLKKKRS